MNKLGRWRWDCWQPLDYLGLLFFWLLLADAAALLVGEFRLGLLVAYAVGATLFVMVAVFLLIALTVEDSQDD